MTESFKQNYWATKASPLLGSKLLDVVIDTDDMTGEEFIGLVFQKPNREIITMWLLSDEEGNGAGRYDLQKEGKPIEN